MRVKFSACEKTRPCDTQTKLNLPAPHCGSQGTGGVTFLLGTLQDGGVGSLAHAGLK